MVFASIPTSKRYLLLNLTAPLTCIQGAHGLQADHDGLCSVDIEVQNGKIQSIVPAGCGLQFSGLEALDMGGSMCWPTFVDLHTHIDKGHTSERSRNPYGNLSGADRSTAADADFWNEEDVYRRMDFSLRCAYAHGTSALRTHLINMTEQQIAITWPIFNKLRRKWAGKVDLQGVSLTVLSYFRNKHKATQLADIVKSFKGVLGAAVCCSEDGGLPSDDWTTCDRDREELLDFVFTLAKERDLDLDFHVDENGNELARGLRHISQMTIKHGYQGRVVCGHCCSLAFQAPEELEVTLKAAATAGVVVVSLPLVNEWTQDRDPLAKRTPRWRGITTLHELQAAGVPVAVASDNTRDQFYAYGDLDMLEVFTQAVRIAQLDRPYGDWPATVSRVPAAAMRMPQHGLIAVNAPADFVLFRARRYSELLSRPQYDRIVVRRGVPTGAVLPDYRELDYLPEQRRYAHPLVGDAVELPPLVSKVDVVAHRWSAPSRLVSGMPKDTVDGLRTALGRPHTIFSTMLGILFCFLAVSVPVMALVPPQ